jgi:hypothetical protein
VIEMKRFLIDTSVENAEGTQTWFVDAETEEEALDKFSAGGCDLYESNVDVTQCGEPEISGEVPLDDFGRFAEQPPAAQRTCVGLTDEEYSDLYFSVGYAENVALWQAIEAKLKEKNNGGPQLRESP